MTRGNEYTDSDGIRRDADGRRLCHAQRKDRSGLCGGLAVADSKVCRFHGGTTKAAKTAASARRLLFDAAPRAVRVLVEQAEDESLDASTRQRAAASVLDRAGYGPKSEVTVTDAETLLRDKLVEAIQEQDVIEGEVVDEDG